jgi:hypothetical protein
MYFTSALLPSYYATTTTTTMKFTVALFMIAAASQQALAFAPATPPASYRTAVVARCWWCDLNSQIKVTSKSSLGVVINRYSTRLMGNMPGESEKLVFPSDSPIWDTKFPGQWLVSKRKVIFVRQCYIDLYALCRRAWGDIVQGLFLKGTTGIGKSFFLDYVMSNLLNDGKTVLLLSGPRNKAWLCSGFDRPAESCSLDIALTDDWAKKADFVLFDPHEDARLTQNLHVSIFCNKKFLIAVSPYPVYFAKVVKDAKYVGSIYMGPTTLEESESMRICCYNSNVTSERVQQRFELCGGIPRFLFKSAGVLSTERNVDAAVAAIQERQAQALDDLVNRPRRIDAGSLADDVNSLWSLYHLVPSKNYRSYSIELCSPTGHNLVLHALLKKKARDLWYLFDSTDTKERYGTLRGIRYEAYAKDFG